MPLPNCLQRRGSTYWLRRRVPDALRNQIGKTEIKRSLKTADLAEAKRRLTLELVKVQAEFDDAMRRKQQQPSADAIEVEISDQEAWSLAAQWFVAAEKRQQMRGPESVDEARLIDFGHLTDVTDTNTLASVQTETKRFLRERNLQFSPDSSAFRRVERLLHEAMIESEKRQIARFLPSVHVSPNPRFQALSAASTIPDVAPITLKDLLARFRSDRSKQPKSPKTRLKQTAQDRLFLELLGAETPVDQIGREQARRVQNIIARLPPNWTKRFERLPISEVERMTPEQLGPPMASATANSYLTAFGALMEFAVNEHLVARNAANGLRLAPAVTRVKPRLPFTIDELNRIFSAPLFVGCVDDMRRYRLPGPNRPRRSRFWIPLVALFSGMRLNEICQLCEDDVIVKDGTDLILVRSSEDGSKRVKTRAGERFVPIHPELKRIGLIEHVHHVREGGSDGSRIFSDLTEGTTGYLSDNFSKWFAHFLDSVGLSDSKKTFHSFRHTYTDALREADMPVSRVKALGGSSGNGTEERYGSGLSPRSLGSAIEKVGYRGLNLQHLHRSRDPSDSPKRPRQ